VHRVRRRDREALLACTLASAIEVDRADDAFMQDTAGVLRNEGPSAPFSLGPRDDRRQTARKKARSDKALKEF